MKRLKNAWLVLTGRAVAVPRTRPHNPTSFVALYRAAMHDANALRPYRPGL